MLIPKHVSSNSPHYILSQEPHDPVQPTENQIARSNF